MDTTELVSFFCFYGAKKSKCNGKYFVVIEFNNKRSLEVYRYFPLFVYTNVYKGLRKKKPLTSRGWPGITTGCCSSPVGCKGSHRTPASHRVTLRAGAKETANTCHCAPTNTTPPALAEKQDCSFLPIIPSSSLWSPYRELLRLTLVELTPILCSTQSRVAPFP